MISCPSITSDSDPKESGGKSAIRGNLIRLALPSMGEYILKMMVGVVDTAFVGRLGAEALAVSGLSWAIIFYCTMPLFGLNHGISAIVARYWGAKDYRKASRAAGQALMINVVASVFITAFIMIFGRSFLRLIGASPPVVEIGVRFLNILASMFTFASMMFAAHDILKSTGDTRTPMFIIGFINLINIVLDYALIYGKFGFPAHGVLGVAEASAFVRFLGAVLAFGGLFWGWYRIKILPSDFACFDWDMIKKILKIGGPSLVENFFFSTASTFFTGIITGLGTLHLAVHSVLIHAESFSFMPGIGFSIAAGILVGQALGEGNREKAKMASWEAIKLGTVIMGSAGILFFFFPAFIIKIFTDDPAVIELGSRTLRIVAIIQPVQGLMFCLMGALRGAGDTATTMKISLAGLWLVRVPAAYLMAVVMGLGVTGGWGGMSMDIAFKTLWLMNRFRKEKWLDIKV